MALGQQLEAGEGHLKEWDELQGEDHPRLMQLHALGNHRDSC